MHTHKPPKILVKYSQHTQDKALPGARTNIGKMILISIIYLYSWVLIISLRSILFIPYHIIYRIYFIPICDRHTTSRKMEFLKIIAQMPPASRQLILSSYMGGDKGFFMAGYMVGWISFSFMTSMWSAAYREDASRCDNARICSPSVRSLVGVLSWGR